VVLDARRAGTNRGWIREDAYRAVNAAERAILRMEQCGLAGARLFDCRRDQLLESQRSPISAGVL
jgi:hypothetical protein